MQCERPAGPCGSRARGPRRSLSARRRSATSFLACLPVLAGVTAGCTGLPDVLQSPPANELAARAPEDAARHRRLRPRELESFRLANGLAVVLLADEAAGRVVVDTWIGIGVRDETTESCGAAEVFERLVHAAAARLPDELETAGGSSSASTGVDFTRGFSMGPPELLPLVLGVEAARLAALDEGAVRAELERRRRADGEAQGGPYASVERLLPAALYPPEHPYHRPPSAGVAPDPDAFAGLLGALHVPANASLVVAGAFDARAARAEVERAFGALPARPAPERRPVPTAAFSGERRVVARERIAVPKLVLAWHSPPAHAPGDAELDLVATLLAEGPDSRLERRLVLDERLAQEVDASQLSAELGSVFLIEALAAPGADLDELARAILDELDDLVRVGPADGELERAQGRAGARFLRRMESLLARAEAVQAYRRAFGAPDGFERDLARWTAATAESVRAAARATFAGGRVDLRVLPEEEPERAPLSAHR
jgi:zinc protease